MSFNLKPVSMPDAPGVAGDSASDANRASDALRDLASLDVPNPQDAGTPGWQATGPDDFDPQLVELAVEVLGQCRVALMLTYRFLDAALWRMPFEPAPILRTVETDGATLWFNPILVLRRFREDSNELVRDMLHAIVHCILRHPYDATHENARAWWIACDMATEAMSMEMAGASFPSSQDGRRRQALEGFRSAMTDVLTPERIYRAIDVHVRWMDHEENPNPAAGDLMRHVEVLFARDSHARWPQLSDDGDALGEGGEERNERTEHDPDADPSSQTPAPSSPDDNGNEKPDERQDEEGPQPSDRAEDERTGDDQPENGASAETDEASGDGTNAEDSQGARAAEASEAASSGMQPANGAASPSAPDPSLAETPDESEREWQEISRRIQEDLETFSRQQGSSAGSLLANVAIANRKPVDYADFLRRFATMREDMQVNDDEFDYIFYTYGLELYGNMPLVEPLEYQETHRVRDFVIAIDTSGSTSGALVSNFIDRTFQILRESEEFAGKVNIHIVQCDTAIREDTKITTIDELHRFRDRFQVKGMGGTDFRPVFAYVDKLVDRDEFDKLGGVIYFTDGYGTFPKRPPDYPVAFVFVEDRGDPRNVPPWAMKVVLRDDQLRDI